MSNSPPLPPVRIRRRPGLNSAPSEQPSSAERLLADSAEKPRKKRKANSGSFKRGEPSRNPQGRPKGAKGKKALVRKVLLETVTVRLPSGPKKLTIFEALLLKERDLAFSGEWRARKTILELGRWALPEDVLEEARVPQTSDAEADRAIIAWFEEELREKERQTRKAGK